MNKLSELLPSFTKCQEIEHYFYQEEGHRIITKIKKDTTNTRRP